MAGEVLGVEDAARAVAALPGELEGAGGIAVEGDAELVEQQLLHRGRTLAYQLLDRRRIRGAVAGGHNVRPQSRRVARLVNDAALSPIAVRHEGAVEREQFHAPTRAGYLEGVGRTR